MRGVRRDRCAAGCNEAWAFLLLWIEGSVLLGFLLGVESLYPSFSHMGSDDGLNFCLDARHYIKED